MIDTNIQIVKLYIKNMVCGRCKSIVKNELDKLGLHYTEIKLGEVTIEENISSVQSIKLKNALLKSGFELIDDQKNILIEKLKSVMTDLEHFSDEDLKTSYSDYITLNVANNFISLNTLFSEIEGLTIEKYIIIQKIELVKELLVYHDLTLAEIAHKMHYSNALQLSRQFKSITGLTPSHFRQMRQALKINPILN